jgi:hypothetical protein
MGSSLLDAIPIGRFVSVIPRLVSGDFETFGFAREFITVVDGRRRSGRAPVAKVPLSDCSAAKTTNSLSGVNSSAAVSFVESVT